MLYLTLEQHQEVVRRLLSLVRSRTDKIPLHPSGLEYTSLMISLLLHNLSVAEVLLRLAKAFGNEWFPVTAGYAVVRTMFETDVTGHYLSHAPAERARQYIDFAAVLKKGQLDACFKHKSSKAPSWREAMNLAWQQYWGPRQLEICNKFDAIAPAFTHKNKKGRKVEFKNWSGKTLYQMAVEVDHVEAYDIFYAELSSFTHVDVHLADRFLQNHPDGPMWSQRANESDVGHVFRYAASFLTCYLELFGKQFKTWTESEVQNMWVQQI